MKYLDDPQELQKHFWLIDETKAELCGIKTNVIFLENNTIPAVKGGDDLPQLLEP